MISPADMVIEPSPLNQARRHARAAAATPDVDPVQLATLFAQLAQAEETHRLRREVRALADDIKRLIRTLSDQDLGL